GVAWRPRQLGPERGWAHGPPLLRSGDALHRVSGTEYGRHPFPTGRAGRQVGAGAQRGLCTSFEARQPRAEPVALVAEVEGRQRKAAKYLPEARLIAVSAARCAAARRARAGEQRTVT